MSKFTDMQKQLEQVSGRKTSLTVVESAPTVEATEKAIAEPRKATSRDHRTHIGAYLPPDFKTSLRLVQAQTGKDMQTLIGTALNDLFKAHKVPVVDLD